MKIKLTKIISSLCIMVICVGIFPKPALADYAYDKIWINDGSNYTNNRNIKVHIKYEFGDWLMKVICYYIEEKEDFDKASFEIFKTEKDMVLPDYDGVYIVKAAISNVSDSKSGFPANRIYLDRQAPFTPAMATYTTVKVPATECFYIADSGVFQYPHSVSINKKIVSNSFTAYLWVADSVSGISSVKFPVWTENNGQDDLIWHEATDTGQYWVDRTKYHLYSCTINTSSHKNEDGKYNIDAYAYDKAGNMAKMGGATVTSDQTGPTIAGLSASAEYVRGDSFTVYAEGVADGSGVAKVEFPTWTEGNDQDDIIWHQGTYDSSTGRWYCTINRSEHNNETGLYAIDAYAYDNAGNSATLGRVTVTIDKTPPTAISISASAAYTNADSFTVYADASDHGSGIATIRFYSMTPGNNLNGLYDTVWREGTYDASTGKWFCTINKSQPKNEGGKYTIMAFAYDKAGNSVKVGETIVTIDKTAPTLAGLSTSTAYTKADSFTVYAEGVTDTGSGIASVKFPTWTDSNGQDDIVWHEGTYDSSSGKWYCTINRSEHNNETGLYAIDVYAYDKVGNSASLGRAAVTIDQTAPIIAGLSTPKAYTKEDSFTVYATGVTDTGSGIASVKFPTWTVKNGQDDIIWHEGSYNSETGIWECTINKSEHNNETGQYVTHVYAYDRAGNEQSMAQVTVTIDQTAPTISSLSALAYNSSNSYTVYAEGVSDPGGEMAGVKFATWTEKDGQDDIIWSEGAYDLNWERWYCIVKKKEHQDETGKYITHAYVYDKAGMEAGPVMAEVILDQTPPTATGVTTPAAYTNEDSFTVYAEGVNDSESGVSCVKFAVSTEKNGKDDIIWHQGQYDFASGKWYYTVNKSEHKNETGKYNIEGYAYDRAGNYALVGATTVTIDKTHIAPPVLTTAAQTIDADTINIEGRAVAGLTIKISRDQSLVATGKTGTDGKFSVKINLNQNTVNTISVTASNGAGKESAASTIAITEDSMAPTVVISTTATDPTNISPIPITITFSEAVNGFALEDITVENGTTGNLRGSGTTYTADITPLTQGTITVNIAAGIARGTKGHDNKAAKQLSITFEIPKPIVTTGSSGYIVLTNAATPTITAEPAGTTVSVGGAADLSVTAGVSQGSLSYQWYKNTTNSNSGGELITGATNAMYSVPTATEGTYYYYCIITNTDNTATGNQTAVIASQAAAVTVDELTNAVTPTITTEPIGTTVSVDGAVYLSVTAGVSQGILSYQWYKNTVNSNSGGDLITDATNEAYAAPTTTAGTYYYYCIITNTDNTATGIQTAAITSQAATVTVDEVTNAETPIITAEPEGITVNSGLYAYIFLTASVSQGTLSYQWYSNASDSNSGGILIPGANDYRYVVPTETPGTYYYYCIVTNTDSTATGETTATITSNVAVMIVNNG